MFLLHEKKKKTPKKHQSIFMTFFAGEEKLHTSAHLLHVAAKHTWTSASSSRSSFTESFIGSFTTNDKNKKIVIPKDKLVYMG